MPDKVMTIIDGLLAREGGYVNDPRDRGGETKFGITEAVARANGYAGEMKDLPRSVAAAIYRAVYWVRPGFATIAMTAPKLAEELFDTGVNMGPGVAIQFLQRALNVLGANPVDQDGKYGTQTHAAFKAYMTRRGAGGEDVLLKAVEGLQVERYISLAEKREPNKAFIYGWLRTRIGNVA